MPRNTDHLDRFPVSEIQKMYDDYSEDMANAFNGRAYSKLYPRTRTKHGLCYEDLKKYLRKRKEQQQCAE